MSDDDTKDPDQEPIIHDKYSKYNKYPLKPTMWQRTKEMWSNQDNYFDREALRKRRLRATDQDE